ncbi:glycosyltransferase [Paenibacillus sp. NPDC056722]|uniref:glycosyltransferase n=1 Tax=Paenibacillus sp. NPDC056722 TaxID=3345924 RepID=UPI0036938E30
MGFSFDEEPLVSIVVPVYNSEKHLRNCMESLIHQTLSNIEIVAVDDGSTDNSLVILKEYEKRYPEKVIVRSIDHVHGAGAPRNVAIEIARSKYIGFCDSDDVMDKKAMELLYNKAIEQDYDIVCAPLWIKSQDSKVLYGEMREPLTTEQMILGGQVYLPNKLIHRRLLLKAGKMPEGISTEDLGYSLVLHSYAERIGYVNSPVYSYIKRYGSDSNSVFELRNLDTIEARKYALKQCNQLFREYVATYIARHLNSDFRKRWIFIDRYIQQLKELWPELKDNEILKRDNYLYTRLSKFSDLPNETIPRNVFIGGFGASYSDELIKKYQETVYYDNSNIIILNELNCDVNEKEIVKLAYNLGDYEFVNGYFAIKSIEMHGGIYLDRRILIEAPFNYVLHCKVFFNLLDQESYSDWVFGGLAQNEIMKKILATYDESCLGKTSYTLSERIKNVMDEEENVTVLNDFIESKVTVFTPEVMVCNITDPKSLKPEPHICSHDLTSRVFDEEYITIKKSTLRTILHSSGANDELNEIKKENALLRNTIREIELREEVRTGLV